MASISIIPVEPDDRRLHREFIRFPKRLYAENPHWVPFLNIDMRAYLRKRHPYFLEYPAQFFLARNSAGETVGTMLVSYNPVYVKHHDFNTAHFFFFDFIDDDEVVDALFAAADEWASKHGAQHICGPLMNGGGLGTGMLIEGYDRTATMTFMRYNFPYYRTQVERAGFEKLVDLNTYYIDTANNLRRDPRSERLLDIVKKRSKFEMTPFRSRKHLMKVAYELAHDFYNPLLGQHIENYPLSTLELEQLLTDLKLFIRKDLFFLLSHEGKPVGYALGYPDMTRALQLSRGRLSPLTILRLFFSYRRSEYMILNGMGIVEEYQRRGGNVLLHDAIFRWVEGHKTRRVEFNQISEKTVNMTSELSNYFDGKAKVHRIYTKKI